MDGHPAAGLWGLGQYPCAVAPSSEEASTQEEVGWQKQTESIVRWEILLFCALYHALGLAQIVLTQQKP